MPQFHLKKVVAICFLEAVKGALEQLGARRLELSEQGASPTPELTRIYGDVRRLRDHLQRCVTGAVDQVELDVDPADVAVLVACCRHAVEAIDGRIAAGELPEDERQWLQKKQQVIAHWALEMAARPLVELPLARANAAPSEAMRAFASRLQQKLSSGGGTVERPKIAPEHLGNRSSMLGVPSFGDQVVGMAAPPAGNPYDPDVGRAMPAAAPRASTSQWEALPSAPLLFDHRKLCDPRLRALAAADVRSFARAVAANDYRLATVLMAAALEAAVLDHVLPRRGDFGVTGAPDTWNVQELVLTALGELATPKDRSLVFHLFSARNMLRPAVQVVAPTVVTVASFEILRDFVQRALHGLGFGVASGSMPPDM